VIAGAPSLDEEKTVADRPNILYLLNDHQAYYRHGWDGGPAIQRPHFARLAAGGINFARAYTACPLCGPARRTMLTGLFPHNHREIKNDSGHPYDREVYLDLLADQGYRCYYYGKWHAGPGTALDHGCEGFNYPSYNNPYTKPEYKAYLDARGLPVPEILIERNFWPPVRRDGAENPMRVGKRYRQEQAWCNEHASGVMVTPDDGHEAFFLANLACDRLRELAGSADDRPFALRVDFWGPHQPYFPTRRFADMYDPAQIPEYPSYRDTLQGKPEIYWSEANVPLNEDGRLKLGALPWSEWQKVLARSYAQTTLTDEAGGRVLDTLEELGLAENTLVVWATDHGDAAACHGGHFDKRSYMPEEMVRVPFAIRLPGRIPAGQVSNALVSNIDLAPTFLDAAGTSFHDPVDGKSLLPLASGETGRWREDLMTETHGHMEDHIGRLVATDRYKYVANRGDLDELYDLWTDPHELTNLVEDSAHGEVLTDMKQRLRRWQGVTKDPEIL
jgi:arylsulfatase A-like enzyme